MKVYFSFLGGLVFMVFFVSCMEDRQEVKIKPDVVSLIRNPAMGWGIYIDNYVKNNNQFWEELGDAPDNYCSFLYIRVLWSYMEPEEGKYAWLYDENYKELIQEALRRGLKLHFRVFYDSQDMRYPATPTFVQEAGAKGYHATNGRWSPYIDDVVFQEKLTNFIEAFAAEYDNPDIVDCIDAFNIGWWGEGHHVTLQDPDNYRDVALWITDTYGNAFKNVLLVINYHHEVTETILDEILERQDYILRHDAYGSEWFNTFEENYAKKHFPEKAFLAESCYWFVGIDKGKRINSDGTDDTERWRNDNKHFFNSWHDVYRATYEEAEKTHANTLDLREYREVQSWLNEAPEIVEKFMVRGGYRFTPMHVEFPNPVIIGEEFSIQHTWVNSGFGKLPNNNKRWNYKYKPAFALMDQKTIIYPVGIDENAEPSDWLENEQYSYNFKMTIEKLPPGTYKLLVSIVDKNTHKPGIRLAAENVNAIDGWLEIGEIILKDK